MNHSTLRLIGAPTDVGASMRGAGLGPEALRVAGLPEALTRLGLTVNDAGNLTGPTNPWQPPVNGHRHLKEVLAWNQQVFNAVSAALAASEMPMLLGGDHCLAMGSIGAVAAHCRATGQHLRVIWLDAHADFNTSDITPSGNLHGMPVAVLFGLGPDDLVHLSAAGLPQPALARDELRLIGVRSVDDQERQFVHAQGLEVFDMRHLDEHGMRAVMQQALMGVDERTHLHVSFDVDFLDPDIAPGVGTAVRGGPTYREAQLCMEMIADTGRLSSLDVMELNPARDLQNRTAELVVDLVESLFGKSTLMRLRS
ncbi:arginase [Aquabacterium sp. CECT 9606]|uniref:arginase n=1 Tax=Aquabacterium sp. CECT 9606 TaxID=2845822 RepID=UPI001E3174DF|nr:arginase [Aquabacterium sp. CECT 9606]CAH0348471.1 Arginase [Aquabacterium sp. CECT 9606]